MDTTLETMTNPELPVREKINVPSDNPITEVGDEKVYTNVSQRRPPGLS